MDPSRTLDPKDLPPPSDRGGGGAGRGVTHHPVVELLVHPTLARVGQVHLTWDADVDPQGVLTLGRRTPDFQDGTLTSARTPLEDPFISRSQACLQWLPDHGAFVIIPSADARQPVSTVNPVEGTLTPVTTAVRVPEGTLVALGRRVLLRLSVGPRRESPADALGLLGRSEAMAALRAAVVAVARFREPALILGETGAGKELVARAIHHLGGGRGGFVAVNAGGLDPATAAAALFGDGPHGAGALDAARDGTLFLDEVGDLGTEIQKKLVRVMEDRTYFPVGSRQPVALQCRVLAATHAPLRADVDAGHFRRDLYERLRTLTVAVPPLREHREDVPVMYVRCLEEVATQHPELSWLLAPPESPAEPRVTLDFFLDLLKKPWAGNVRELRNHAMATAAATLAAGRFTPAERTPGEDPGTPARRPGVDMPIPTTEAMEAALTRTQGNVRAAAAVLGCSRHQLYRWMDARSLDPARFRVPGAPDT